MKKQAKTVIAALMLTCALSSWAVTPKILVDSGKEGAQPLETGLSIDTKITFTSAGLQIDNGGNVSNFAYGDVAALRFVTTPVSVSINKADGVYALRSNPVESVIEITGYAGEPVPVHIYSAAGSCVYSVAGWQGESIDASVLAPGLYVMTVKNETFKFIKK